LSDVLCIHCFPYTTLFRSNIRDCRNEFFKIQYDKTMINFNLDRDLIFLDIESTGLHVIHDRIIQLALIKYSKDQDDPVEYTTIRSEEHTSELQSRENLVCS